MLAYPLTEKAFRAMVAQRRVGEAAAALDAADPVDTGPGDGRDAKG